MQRASAARVYSAYGVGIQAWGIQQMRLLEGLLSAHRDEGLRLLVASVHYIPVQILSTMTVTRALFG